MQSSNATMGTAMCPMRMLGSRALGREGLPVRLPLSTVKQGQD